MNEWITNNSLSGYLYVLRTNQSLPDSLLEPPESRPWVGPEEALNRGQCFQKGPDSLQHLCASVGSLPGLEDTRPLRHGRSAPAPRWVDSGSPSQESGSRLPSRACWGLRQQAATHSCRDSEDRSWARETSVVTRRQSPELQHSCPEEAAGPSVGSPRLGCSISEFASTWAQWRADWRTSLETCPGRGHIWSYEWCLWSWTCSPSVGPST